MSGRTILLASLALSLAACAAAPMPPDARERPGSTQPGFDPLPIEADLVTSARAKFGPALVGEAMRQPDWLIVKRYYVMLPPPPPAGQPQPPPPEPPLAMLARRDGVWLFATTDGWRQARPENVAEIERIATSQAFRDEPAHYPPCPDYGAVNLVLKLPGRDKVVRNHACVSQTDRLASAALGA